MKSQLALLAGIAVSAAIGPARAEEPLKDHILVRGVNYGMNADQAALEREPGHAGRVNQLL